MRETIALLLLAFSLNACQTVPRPISPLLDQKLAALVLDRERPLASLSVAAVRAGRLVVDRQFGFRMIDNTNPANNIAADSETMYRIASISKLITTLGVMKLVEEGKLALDVDVSTYLGYTLRNPHFPDAPITLTMLLNHTSSLRDDAGYYWEAKENVNLKDVLTPGGARHGKGEMWGKEAAPGGYFQYTNFSWGVIGTIMERVSGERFDRLMRRLILDPMGLPGGFHPADFSASDLDNTATLYRKRSMVNGKEVWNTAGPWVAQVDDYRHEKPIPRANADYVIGTNGTLFGPQGNCRLSAKGLAEVMLMLMNGGKHAGKQILRAESVDTMLSRSWQHNGKTGSASNGSSEYEGSKLLFNAWGLGNQHFVDRSIKGAGDRLVARGGFTAHGHLGDAWGLTSAMVFNRERREGMIFLIGGPGFNPGTNPGSYSGLYRHEEQILDALYEDAVRQDGK